MPTKKTPRTRAEGRYKAVHGIIRTGRTRFLEQAGGPAGKCEVCLAPMELGKHGQRKRFCSTRCRRLGCSADEVIRAIVTGKGGGLRPRIEKLATVGVAAKRRRVA